MLNASQLESMAKQLAEALPQGFGEAPENVKNQFKMALSSTLAKMDLVSREEFDVQAGVLAKTRLKLEALEKQVAELEVNLAEQNSASKEDESTSSASHELPNEQTHDNIP